jgi:hypothetical protein
VGQQPAVRRRETIGAFVCNVSADLVGGIEVTLSERD